MPPKRTSRRSSAIAAPSAIASSQNDNNSASDDMNNAFDFDDDGAKPVHTNSARSRRMAKALAKSKERKTNNLTPKKNISNATNVTDININNDNVAVPPAPTATDTAYNPTTTPAKRRLADEFDDAEMPTPTPKRRRKKKEEATATVVQRGNPSMRATPTGRGRGRGRGRPRGSRGRGRGGSAGASPGATRTPAKSPGRPRGRPRKDASQKKAGDGESANGSSIHNGQNSNGNVGNDNDDDPSLLRTRSYFDAHCAARHRTSNCTLADLHLPSAEVMNSALRAFPDLLADERGIQLRKACSVRRIKQFMYQLHAGSSLLFYGTGSKRKVLQSVVNSLAEYYDTVEVNGFNPALSMRNLMGKIVDTLDITEPFARRTLQDYANAISALSNTSNTSSTVKKKKQKRKCVAVVIHNIEGPSLRSEESQRALSHLAKADCIHLVASMDNVKGVSLWDGPMWANFSWAWVNVNTFAGFGEETIFAAKNMLHGTKERRVEGAVMLLKSLSNNARKVFALLAKSNGNECGKKTTFNGLFESCRREFICTDTGSLRSILTELETHDMLGRRRGADAEEQIWIPLSEEQLKCVLDQITK